MIKNKINMLFVLSMMAAPAMAQGQTGAQFLKVGVGARALGLGSAYTAAADDVTALHWNPAGLSQIHRQEVAGMHAEMFANTRYDFIGYAHPGKSVQFGIGAAYLNQGTMEGRAGDRARTEDFGSSDLAVTFGLSRKVAAAASAGVNLKLIRSQIADHNANGFAFDIGSQIRPASQWTFGLALQNVGPSMRFDNQSDPLPLALAGGAAYQLMPGLLLSADVKQELVDSETIPSVGMEFSPVSFMSLRTGYIAQNLRPAGNNSGDSLSNLTGFGFGVGFKARPGSIDYSFNPSGELGNVQRLSLAFGF